MAEYGEPLSEREKEVLELVATGATNRQIAQELFVSVNTVKVHLRNVFTKLGVESRTEATLVAIRENWVSVPTDAEGTEAALPEGVVIPQAEPTEALPPLPWSKRLALVIGFLLVALISAVTWPQSQTAEGQQDRGTHQQSSNGPSPGVSGEITKWRALAPMNIARSNFALVATVDGQLFAIGGETSGGVIGAVEKYSPGTDQWSILDAAKPTRVSNVGAAIIGRQIVVPGGRVAEGEPTAIVEAYHLDDETWSAVAALPRARSAYALAVYQGRIYLFGGRDSGGFVNTTYIYDFQQDSWREGANMPTSRAYAAAARLGSRIYVVGGYDGQREQTTCEAYSPEEDEWESCEPLILGRSGLGLAGVANQLFAVGGGWSNYLGFSEKRLIDVGDWQPFETPLSRRWHDLALASTPNKFFVAGGWNGSYLNGVWEYEVLPYKLYIPEASQ